MPDVFGFGAEGIRKIEEVVRRVLQSNFGKGAKRQRWPVGAPAGGSKIIMFQFVEFVEPVEDLAAKVIVIASSLGVSRIGELETVYDPAGCFFDEAEIDLVGRLGFASLMHIVTDPSLGTVEQRHLVHSLCCPAQEGGGGS